MKRNKVMISQPMNGLSDNEIIAVKERAVKALEARGYEVVNTFFQEQWSDAENLKTQGVENVAVCFLAKSIDGMSKCNAVYFCKGWENARGCKIEHEVAEQNGLEIIEEE